MSFISKLDVCETVVSQETSDFMENEPEQCTTRLEQDSIGESVVLKEEIAVNMNEHLPDEAEHQIESLYFEENLQSCNDMAVRFEESIDTVALAENSSIVERWDSEDIAELSLKENEPEEQEDDEETIATFVTAAGQQLALYAVEDSDEIFAVAVYDESDEPPSNFQFLMKADVERLIGEGAVRTVKKPSQMKKRVFTAQSPIFYHKGQSEVNNTPICDTSVNSSNNIAQEKNGIGCNYETYQNYNDFKINSKSSDSVHTTVDEQSDITYFMMDDNFMNIAEQPDECQDNLESEDELMEHSTVQYILLEADHQSDSELTFDEIQTTLQNMKISRKKALETNDKKSSKLQNDRSNIQEDCASLLKDKSSLNEDTGEFESYVSSMIDQTCISASENDRQRLIDTLTDLPPSITATASQMPMKIKRSRKQQLISVDRDDGEIIIQPASMLNEELINKKRTIRRRQLSSQIRVAMTNMKGINRTKRIKRTKRRKVVEVIDLDIDEEEQQTTRNIVEITLDDNKDKYSSDKENEIIMVRDSDSDDSDDEEEEEKEKNEWQPDRHLTKLNGVIRCEYCSKNFRYRRTLDIHLLTCQKSPTKTLNLDKRKPKSKENQKVEKQYTCKICQEKFDVVVALARHARAVHSQKKKHKLSFSSVKTPSKSSRLDQRKEMTLTKEEESVNEDKTTTRELSMLARVKRKRKQRNNYSLETKKLNCADCGRWFPSTALLDAHSLHHGTKKSEQLRKCHICKKLIKSKLLFLQHLKVHNDTQHNSGSSSRMLRRKLRARPNTRKIVSPRKRGRPRKF